MKLDLILRVTTKLILPFMLLFALYVQFHGDYGPGGGFQAGVIAAGMIILAGAGIVSMLGIHLANFAIGLVLLGIGWNFGFVGATAMVTSQYRPSEKNIVQGINDFCVFATVAVASFSSGKLLHLIGWNAVNVALYPMIAVSLILLGWLAISQRNAEPAPG